MSKKLLADTGFWIALLDEKDQHYQSAGERAPWIDVATLVMPWPVLYETLRTRLVRMSVCFTNKYIHVQFIDDGKYRDEAYSRAIDFSVRLRRPISLVDMVCRLLIADPAVRIDYLLTTNPRDFTDVCSERQVELL